MVLEQAQTRWHLAAKNGLAVQRHSAVAVRASDLASLGSVWMACVRLQAQAGRQLLHCGGFDAGCAMIWEIALQEKLLECRETE